MSKWGVRGRLLKGIKAFYENCRARIRVGMELTECCNELIRLRQGCALSPWLFNMLMDDVVRGKEREGKSDWLRCLKVNGK